METTTREISQTANSTTEGTPQIKTESFVKEITIKKPTPFTDDYDAGEKFIDQNYTRMKGIKMEALKEPIQ